MTMNDLMNQQGKAEFVTKSSGNSEYDKWAKVIEEHGGAMTYYKRDPQTGKPMIEDPGSPIAMEILRKELSLMGLI